jgi:tetratricopeptide (TPR) repeat protein
MYSMLDDLLYDEWVSDSDFSLAIYQALLDEKYELALEYAKRWSVNFPESATFYGYIADIHMKMWNKKLAIEAVEDGKRIDPKDISIVFHEWKMYMDQWNYSKAFLSFRRVISLSKWKGDYVDQANAELEIIKNERNK